MEHASVIAKGNHIPALVRGINYALFEQTFKLIIIYACITRMELLFQTPNQSQAR